MESLEKANSRSMEEEEVTLRLRKQEKHDENDKPASPTEETPKKHGRTYGRTPSGTGTVDMLFAH